MQEIHKLRAQMSTIASSTLRVPVSSNDAPLFSPKLAPPNTTQLKILRQLITSAFIDQIAVRKDLVDPSSSTAGARFQSTRGVAYRAMGADAEDVYIHPSSVMFHGEPPEWLVFQDLVRTSKVWVKSECVAIASSSPPFGNRSSQ
jgi:ATP-dependent RNA helicase DHX37/DHR1